MPRTFPWCSANCTPGSVEEVAAALACLRDDPELRSRLGIAGLEHAARFSVQASADALLAAWRDVVARG